MFVAAVAVVIVVIAAAAAASFSVTNAVTKYRRILLVSLAAKGESRLCVVRIDARVAAFDVGS